MNSSYARISGKKKKRKSQCLFSAFRMYTRITSAPDHSWCAVSVFHGGNIIIDIIVFITIPRVRSSRALSVLLLWLLLLLLWLLLLGPSAASPPELGWVIHLALSVAPPSESCSWRVFFVHVGPVYNPLVFQWFSPLPDRHSSSDPACYEINPSAWRYVFLSSNRRLQKQRKVLSADLFSERLHRYDVDFVHVFGLREVFAVVPNGYCRCICHRGRSGCCRSRRASRACERPNDTRKFLQVYGPPSMGVCKWDDRERGSLVDCYRPATSE